MKNVTVVASILLVVLAGCQQTEMEKSKTEAYQKWADSRVEVLDMVATQHFKAGNLDQARKKVVEALKLKESNQPMRLLLAKIDIEQGKYKSALKELKRLREMQEPSSGLMYLTGIAQEKQGLPEEALASYRWAYELDNSDSSAKLAGTEVLVAMGKIARAQEFLESRMTGSRETVGAFELAGRVAMMLSQYDKAIHHFRQAMDLDASGERYSRMLARAQFAAGHYSDAAETLRALLDAKSDTAPARLHVMLGDCMMALSKPAKALTAYQVACRIQPDRTDIWVRLSQAALRGNNISKAIRAAQRARDLDANHLEAAIILGYAFIRQGQADRAIAVLDIARAAHPKDGMLCCLLGRAHAALGRDAQARKLYDAAVKLEPENPTAMQLLSSCK